ncbi:UDP-N-acetylmuramoyl-L-alanyl-D-glutamate--2,6-diaminopimelate ligase [Corynebacterium pseudotuberculosis]|uniref:UDP-N-acetylmuramoyl-L-alanyl-D-glutamate--2, 6-diaminopimelate ligase n=1 Tax=Corynebacterium pseudotuberculosis TaxID=1719 RepID=UPI00025922B5|nr:UDP-N-acetylmuramoyl-L-alanyl-D-glutamate--2,6-diaminopimelate ligase [Corynebacterium pseudotuberculosis]AFH91224.1 UDP-N-acetylmuramoyl-L-alanyl-D-glutamate--2,6-diaminopimelate ligase [Corynebacterium pseudotuberculosis 31]APB11260.1 UDP-N-acetylmuramoyl-L-alanyl-D-glutamate--2,6-diaminopimelate ligase [Corynebacterium pseudotuberculosis]APB13303.1 UDP-N-acetylmuramoyl-L-alanyl-D-glutamate--2,6-diaminopimelate ligase [Corynebacterium pseudotuberculosis]APB15348.1 UDP-N-acetylmuramoyl-L-al
MSGKECASVTLGFLAALTGGELHGDKDIVIEEISLDSQELPQGGLFAALPGTRSHGARYAQETQAAAILTDAAGAEILRESGDTRPRLVVENVRGILGTVSAEIYGRPSDSLQIIGITGTSGKTTTSYMLEAGLINAGKSVGLIGTTGTRINGVKIPTKLTTPEAPTLQKLFAQMLTQGVTHVVMEVSSHALSLGRVSATHFAAAGFTNLSQDHLDFHPTMEEYFEAKALLFDPASSVHTKKAVICIDEPWGVQMLERSGAEALSVSMASDTQADFVVSNLTVDAAGGQRFVVTHEDDEIAVDLPIPGAFNVANAALAIGLASSVGIDLDRFVAGLTAVSVPGRMERVNRGQDFLAIVDYAHKPAAVAAVLEAVRRQAAGRVAIVVGAGGDRDRSKRAIMGKESALRADLVIVTDDNPRSEDPALIREAILTGAQKAATTAEIREVGDRREAIKQAVAWAQPTDAVIIAGKGHEVGQLIQGINHHFDDKEELAIALEEIRDNS